MRIIVLGSTGMLGSEVLRVAKVSDCEVVEASRSRGYLFDASNDDFDKLAKELSLDADDYLVNCVGWIPQKAIGVQVEDERQAELLNVQVPQAIGASVEDRGFNWIQIGTDCVFDGEVGGYSELSPKNATDLYGRSKINGEAYSRSAMLIRASIVGPDQLTASGLYSWFKRERELGHSVTGYQNHLWNGVTTTAFARLVVGLAKSGARHHFSAHWIPRGQVSKFELLQLFSKSLSGPRVAIEPGRADFSINRTLSTSNPGRNVDLWRTAGYSHVPTIAELVKELVQVDREREAK